MTKIITNDRSSALFTVPSELSDFREFVGASWEAAKPKHEPCIPISRLAKITHVFTLIIIPYPIKSRYFVGL